MVLKVLTTPFHARLSELSETGLYMHWAGYLTASRYDLSAKHEYFGVRTAAAIYDLTPMYKYWFRGRHAQRFLEGILARDVRTLKVGRAQYQVWCDDDGYVLEDGVLFRYAPDEFLLTCAEPNLGHFTQLARGFDVEVIDAQSQIASLALQGPRSKVILEQLSPEVADLAYFGILQTKLAGHPVTVSRTGFTGDLGYELMMSNDSALPVLDALLEVGGPHQIRPFGDEALSMTRIEAGLPLIHVDFESARFAFNDHQRFTPNELGLGWLLKGIEDPSRPFIGRRALLREQSEGLSRWATVGLVLDWKAYFDLHESNGLIPTMDEQVAAWETMLYDSDHARAGWATSLMYSPMRQAYIAIAKVRPELSAIGTIVQVEHTVNHEYYMVPAEVVPLPFFNPPRKVSMT
jgi:aminomethyltransferase